MRTSVTTFHTRAQQRLWRTAQQAMLHARPGEAHQIDRVITAVDEGALSVRDAHLSLVALRRDQQA